MTSEIKVDTISEQTSANGVAVDGVTLKDGAVGAAGTATSVAGIPFYFGNDNSIYTHDVSGTDNQADQNTAYGITAMDAITTGDDNTAIGNGALSALNTGEQNTAVGRNAMLVATNDNYNTVIGSSAGRAITGGGNNNTLIGIEAGRALTTGDLNVAVGSEALGNSSGATTEGNNVAIGANAMASSGLNGAEKNVAVGNLTLDALTSGDNNVVMGYQAGGRTTTGYANSFFGHSAGLVATTGNQNVCIGNESDVSAAGNTNAIAIGIQVTAASNDFSFGKANNIVTNDFDADADWSRSSDIRLKRNIEDTTLGLQFINDLRPVKFQWKPSNEVPEIMTAEYNEKNQKNLDYISHGFIAQEVKDVIDKHGDQTFGGWHLDKTDNETQRVKKNMFIMPLIKAVQELSAKVTTLQQEIKILKEGL